MPATVDEYLAVLPEDVAAVVERIRAVVHDVVPGGGERISYGMPTFLLDGRPLVHVAAWKKHVALYPLPATDRDADLEAALAPYRGTKDTLRLPLREEIPYGLVARVVGALVDQRGG